MKITLALLLLSTLPVLAQGTPDILWQKSTPTTPFQGLAVSPDGKLVATAGTNAPVQVWNTTNGSLAHSLTGPTSWIGQLAFTPNGGYLAAASGDQTVTLWETTNWTLVSGFVTRQQGPAIALSPDSSMIAIGSKTNIELRSLPKFSLFRSWTAATNDIPALAFSPDGIRIATANSLLNFSGSVQLFRVADGALLQTYPENASSIAFSPDGHTIVSTGTNIVFRNVDTGALLTAYTDGTSTNEERVVAFSPNGSNFFFGHDHQQLLAARTPLALHPLMLGPNGWTVHRTGGPDTYQLQIKTNLTDAWQNLGIPTTNQTFSISNQFPNAFFRLIGTP